MEEFFFVYCKFTSYIVKLRLYDKIRIIYFEREEFDRMVRL